MIQLFLVEPFPVIILGVRNSRNQPYHLFKINYDPELPFLASEITALGPVDSNTNPP